MRFFTREVYQAMQDSVNDCSAEEESTPDATQRERLCNALTDQYAEHLATIRPTLPISMQEFASVSLHDGNVTSAKLRPDKVVTLEIEGSGYWGPRVAQYADVFEAARARLKSSDACCIALPRVGPSSVTLIFAGVEVVEGLEDIVGDWWLYSEVDVRDGGGFDYRVLLQDSEFRVIAKEVTFLDHGRG